MVYSRPRTWTDATGAPIQYTDLVTVLEHGSGATKADVGKAGRVVGFGRSRVKVRFDLNKIVKQIDAKALAVGTQPTTITVPEHPTGELLPGTVITVIEHHPAPTMVDPSTLPTEDS
jgi:hypothetical protein